LAWEFLGAGASAELKSGVISFINWKIYQMVLSKITLINS